MSVSHLTTVNKNHTKIYHIALLQICNEDEILASFNL